MSDYLNQDKFKEKPASLVFNKGKAGVVEKCKVVVTKKGSDEPENRPAYKIEAFDTDQMDNNDDNIPVYPINKGFFYQDKFKSEASERYSVNELKHLLKTFGHETRKNDKGIDVIVSNREITSFNDFMDYTFEFINKKLKEDPDAYYTVVVDYGNDNYPKSYLQLSGYPWYIGTDGVKLSVKDGALLERINPDEKEKDTFSYDTSTDNETNLWE